MHYSPGESCNGGEYLRAPGDYHCRMLRDRGEFTLQFRKLGGPGEMVYYFNIQDDQGREWWNTDRGDTDEGCNGCDLRLISFPLSDPTEGMVKILDLDRDGAQEILYFYQFEHQGALYYLDLEWENDQPYFDHHTVRNCACSGNDRPSLETLRRCEFADYRRKLEEICRR